MLHKKHTRFEKARIIGARALQIQMGAPVLVELPKNLTDPIDIALYEYEKDAIPITVVRRLPGEARAA
ncbi:MAG: DNA-directed RNA polymerase subunit K [Hadesarchaea archaeon]|nr:DNA-directed RNA polymerase subunit K [Hadesarchaea archaeon]